MHLDCALIAPSNHGSTLTGPLACGLSLLRCLGLGLHWEDYSQGFGIPAVISTSRLVPAGTGPTRRLRPGAGLTTRAPAGGVTVATVTITLEGPRHFKSQVLTSNTGSLSGLRNDGAS